MVQAHVARTPSLVGTAQKNLDWIRCELSDLG